MSAVLAIVTGNTLLHVSDAAEGCRTLVLRHPGLWGLMTLVGPGAPLEWTAAAAAEPREHPEALAHALRDGLALRHEPELGLLYTGWGHDDGGLLHTFRYLVTNLTESGDFEVSGESMIPSAMARGKARGKEPPFSVQLFATVEPSAAVRRKVEGLQRVVKRGDASEIALAAAGVIRELTPGPVLVAHLQPGGELEAAVLDGEDVTPLRADAGTSALQA